MHEEEDDVDTPRLSQDTIPTVAPPRRQGQPIRLDDVPTIQPAPRAADEASDDGASDDDSPDAVSPDDVPTERPPWTDPVESREQVKVGVEIPPHKREA